MINQLRAMSSRESKLVILIFKVALFSCTSENEKRTRFYETDQLITIKESDLVIHLAKDTVNQWIRMRLQYFFYLDSIRDFWRLDDWVFFNSKMDKCIINIPIQQSKPDARIKVNDAITLILGEKISGHWWFYDGPQYAVPRSGNMDNTNTPLSLEFLTKRARYNALSWYYVEKPAGTCLKKLFSEGYESYKKCNEEKYIINDEYFEYEINVGMNPDPKKRIEWYLNVFLKNKFEPDTTGINQ